MKILNNSTAVRFTGRWDLSNENLAVVTTPGAMVEIAFEGQKCTLFFNTDENELPLLHLWIKVDNGAMTEVAIDKFIRLETENCGNHIIKVIYKGGMEIARRWETPLSGKVSFMYAEADSEGVLPIDTSSVIEFIGDSITEGVLIDAFRTPNSDDQKNRQYQDDSAATYAYHCASELEMRPYIVGYGAVGLTRGGLGGVPKAFLSYPYNFQGSLAKPSNAKIIVINHGANDVSSNVTEYLNNYVEFLDLVRKINPNSKIVVVAPFCGFCSDELAEMVEEYNRSRKENIYYINTMGWIPKSPLHPLRDGHKIVGKKLADAIRILK